MDRLARTLMPSYTCRVVVPATARQRIVTIEGDSPSYAANEAHSQHFTNATDSLCVSHSANDGSGREDVYFAVIEVDGERYTSRMFKQGIYRKGGVKPRNVPTLLQQLTVIAKALGWEDDPMELVGSSMWEGEEHLPTF